MTVFFDFCLVNFRAKILRNKKKPFIFALRNTTNAEIAQLVEHNLAKVEVASSRLVSRSRYKRRETLSSFPFFVCGPRMTELVDVADLKSAAFGLWVRIPPGARDPHEYVNQFVPSCGSVE